MVPRSEGPNLIIRVVSFELTQHRETDRMTDGRTTYDSNTALCAIRASRGNKMVVCFKHVYER